MIDGEIKVNFSKGGLFYELRIDPRHDSFAYDMAQLFAVIIKESNVNEEILLKELKDLVNIKNIYDDSY